MVLDVGRKLRGAARLVGRRLLANGMNAQRYDMASNGEAWLIRTLSPELEGAAVIDVGANHGNWSGQVLATQPEAKVYAVEMIPAFAHHLRERIGSRATVIECGLSDKPGAATAFKVGGGGRLVLGDTQKSYETVSVQVKTGDAVVSEYGISNAKLIKIDTDGYDIPVIRGFAETIARNRPVVQFEYSRFYVETRHYLKDAFDFFGPLHYRIGRLMPGWIAYSGYSTHLELFMTNNYVAVPQEVAL